MLQVYCTNKHLRFPGDGKMSQCLNTLPMDTWSIPRLSEAGQSIAEA